MSLVPSLFSSTDTSAPTCSGLAGALTTLLDAVLVNGYGSKSGLGWTIVDSGTNWRVYRHNPVTGTGMYLYVNDAATGSGGAKEALLRGYQTWDVATHTGSLPFPTSAQVSGGIVWKKSNTADGTARPWVVLGNERCFYIGLDANSGVRQLYFAGDIREFKAGDARHYLLSGGETQNVSMSSVVSNTLLIGLPVHSFDSAYTTGYFAANAAASTNSVRASVQDAPQLGNTALHTYCFGTIQGGARVYPGAVSGGLDVARIQLFEGTRMERGEWPGVYQPLHSMAFDDLTVFTGAGPDHTDLIAVNYRRAQTSPQPNNEGQVLFELGVEW